MILKGEELKAKILSDAMNEYKKIQIMRDNKVADERRKKKTEETAAKEREKRGTEGGAVDMVDDGEGGSWAKGVSKPVLPQRPERPERAERAERERGPEDSGSFLSRTGMAVKSAAQ